MTLKDIIDKNREQVFVCVGSMLLEFDSIAPRIGSELKKHGYNVIGTIESPVTGKNIHSIIPDIESLDKSKYQVIGIDASLSIEGARLFNFYKRPLKPGTGADKDLPCIGEVYVAINTRVCLDLPRNIEDAINEEYRRFINNETHLEILNSLRDIAVKLVEICYDV